MDVQAVDWALGSAVVAGVVAVFVLMCVHWALDLAVGRRAPRLVCYVVGLALLLAVYGVWAVVQVGDLPAWVGWLVMCWVSVCGGLGTVAGWALDMVQERRVSEGVRRGQQRAATDRDC